MFGTLRHPLQEHRHPVSIQEVPGLVSVTRYEKGGVRFNFPEMLRRLKRRFDD